MKSKNRVEILVFTLIFLLPLAVYIAPNSVKGGQYTETWSTITSEAPPSNTTPPETGPTTPPKEPSWWGSGGKIDKWATDHPIQAIGTVIAVGAVATVAVGVAAALTAAILAGEVTSAVLIPLILASPLDEMVVGLAVWGLGKLGKAIGSSGPYVQRPKVFEGQEQVKSSGGVSRWVFK